MQNAVVTDVKEDELRIEKNGDASFSKIIWIDEVSRPLCEAKIITFS